MVGEKFYSTMDSDADEFNSLVKESIVFKHFLLVLYFNQPWKSFIQHVWYRSI